MATNINIKRNPRNPRKSPKQIAKENDARIASIPLPETSVLNFTPIDCNKPAFRHLKGNGKSFVSCNSKKNLDYVSY